MNKFIEFLILNVVFLTLIWTSIYIEKNISGTIFLCMLYSLSVSMFFSKNKLDGLF